MRRVVGYVRASTTEQRLGPEAQRAALERWAVAGDAELLEVFEDTASGRSRVDRRPGLLAALGALRRHRADALVAVRRDRFARDVMLAAQIGALARRAGAELLVVDGPAPGDAPEARLMQQLVDIFAEYEGALLRARTSAALRAKLARGEAAGGCPPLGQRIVKGRLVDDEAELAAIRRAAELRAAGLPWPRVTSQLMVEGHRARARSWHAGALARALSKIPTNLSSAD